MKQIPLKLSLNPDSTFSAFFSGEKNALNVAIFQQFLNDDNENFIYIWSAPGQGVTHLLEAVQHQAKAQLCQYLPLTDLLDYPAADIAEGLETLDVICIDDIDVIAGNKEWELALFHLYNKLRDGNKKLIVGGHLSPRELPIVLSDLKSRLQWGTVLYFHGLSMDEKSEALQKRATFLGIELKEEVLRFLLERTDRDIKSLYSVMHRLEQESMVEHRKLTIPFVKKILHL